ncbi:hypothetical protein OHAE_3686 [Ochrobactrum soli]|uniref:Uncharacterized protein n=1 Tax=Ochrobactrum soli TaxID=2448455 RepID=A0A2P9HI26_9HYPH|nr:hypothetical protein OHAE_3686 [[Ochrobactrum] soli]
MRSIDPLLKFDNACRPKHIRPPGFEDRQDLASIENSN